MTERVRAFIFYSSISECDTSEAAVCLVPAGVSSRDELFDVLDRELQFPDAFGRNWDALSDCLRDLSWLRTKRVLIVHEDLPSLDSHALSIYLTVLADSVLDWESDEAHELAVVFPTKVRDYVRELLKEPDQRDGPERRGFG